MSESRLDYPLPGWKTPPKLERVACAKCRSRKTIDLASPEPERCFFCGAVFRKLKAEVKA